MKTISESITNDIGNNIDYIINFEEDKENKPVFLFLHGFKAYKDWGFYPFLCESVARRGAISIRFDFSLSGLADGNNLIYDNDKFSRNTIAQEVEDAKFIINKILSGEILPPDVNFNGKIYLCGHSRGSAIALLVASEFEQVQKLSMISPIASFDRYSERQKEIWKRQGYVEFKMSHSGQKLRINSTYLEDIENNFEKYKLPQVVNTLNKELQIIHGRQDVTVNIKEPYELAYNFVNKELLRFDIIEKAGHGFAASHPFSKANAILDELIEKIIIFLELKK